MFFRNFFIIFQCYNHIFLPNFPNSYSKMQIVDNQFTLHSKSITVLIWYQFFVVKCFFITQWFSQLWCIANYLNYKELLQRGCTFCVYLYLGHDILHPYEDKVDHCKTFFLSIICRMQSFSASLVVNKHSWET